MRLLLAFALCVCLFNIPGFSREVCPLCKSQQEPLSGHGLAPDGSGRRRIWIYIDSSWDQSPGHTVDSIWNGAQSGVSKSIEPGKAVTGSPAYDYTSALRSQAVTRKLPELEKRVNELEAIIKQLLAEKTIA